MPGAEAAYNRGNALTFRGQYEDAVASYERALELRPGWAEAATNRRIAESRIRTETAWRGKRARCRRRRLRPEHEEGRGRSGRGDRRRPALGRRAARTLAPQRPERAGRLPAREIRLPASGAVQFGRRARGGDPVRVMAAFFLLLAGSVSAQEPVLLRTQVRPAGEVWVGARTSVYVTVLMSARPDYSPRFDLPELGNALFFRAPGSKSDRDPVFPDAKRRPSP